jgi:cysteinyl-tRNA synthetase
MPDVLTRVSEFIQPIIVYIQKIIARGLAYESNGSVSVLCSDYISSV